MRMMTHDDDCDGDLLLGQGEEDHLRVAGESGVTRWQVAGGRWQVAGGRWQVAEVG